MEVLSILEIATILTSILIGVIALPFLVFEAVFRLSGEGSFLRGVILTGE